MKIITAISATALLALGGCATCQQHPVYCAIGGAIIVGSVAAIAAQHGHSNSQPDLCGPNAPNRSNGVIGTCVGK